MKRVLSVSFLAAALGCGSVDEKQACSVSTDCPAGEYCALAEGERRCWPDADPPAVGGVSASCAGACLRDGVLHVEATVTDANEVLDAAARLDLDPGRSFAMAPSAGKWVADVPLRELPFEAFTRGVVATVTARDGARNPSNAASAPAATVTRLRWTYDAGAPITSPAVMADGTAVVGVSSTTDQLLAIRADGTKAWSRSVGGTAFVTAAPAIGDQAIWVGSEDFTLHAVALDGSTELAGVGVGTGGAVKGSVAVVPGLKDWAFATSSAGFVGTSSSAPGEDAVAGPSAAYSAGPVVGLDGRAYAATATATLRALRLNTSPAVTLTEAWTVQVGVNVSAPLAVDATGAIWTGTLDGKLSRTVPGDASGNVNEIKALAASIIDSPVILAGGDIVVGDQTGLLHRYSSTGTQRWDPEPNLGAAIQAPMALTGGPASLLVPTAGGRVYAMGADGTEAWFATLEAGKALRAGNLYTPPAQPAPIMSTAYVASESGKLFAVIVDGQLDTAAPWPKAFHDPRNTNRAGPQP